MKTLSPAAFTQRLYQSSLALFTTKALRDLSGAAMPPATFFSLLSRLVKQSILQRIERDKYLLVGATVHDFRIANFLYEPSYVSLEAALNFHGILPQFPYEIASVTPKKPVAKTWDGKTYRYARIKQSLFWGYDLAHGFLIAQPEKALLDLLYLQSKGLAVVHLDEFDLSKLDRQRLAAYASRFPPMKGVDFL
ncbi:MAG: type IV toxin-antitoxin system AbiEi family antitoxin domain-containing protein [Chloroflexota bacterium]